MKKLLLLSALLVSFSSFGQTKEIEVLNLDLLQGKWKSIDDQTNFLIFEGNQRKEISEGMNNWDEETFIVSDRCINGVDEDRELTKEKDRYMSCLESDMCWYIVTLDSKTLIISYILRGNDLTYTRVN